MFGLLSLAPSPVRRRVVQALPARQRRWVVRQLSRSRPVPTLWRPHAQAVGDGYARVRDRRDALVASVATDASPVGVRRDNLTRVMAVLDAAGVPYFRVPHARDQRTVLAVPADHRERVLTALGAPALARAAVRGRGAGPGRRRTAVRDAPVVEVFWPVVDPAGAMLIGDSVACEIEFWTPEGDALLSPRRPAVTPVVRCDSPVVHAADRDFDQFCAGVDDGARFPTRRELMLAGMDWVRFPVDAVYTWVDGSDPTWQRRKNAALAANGWATVNPQTANPSRYLCRDELRYSLRSLHYFAPWLRRVFLVTDAQVPEWLDTSHPQVTVVDHREIFGAAGTLPTFNSHAIETRLHHIPGLAEHFLYLNDDVFLGRPQTPDQYFLPSGIARFFPSSLVVEAGPATPDDPPVMSAGKNNRALVAEHFNRLLTHKIRHTPYPQRRSVLAEIERRCAEPVRRTAERQFRHPDDVSVPASLQHYWSYLTGRAVPGNIDYLYTDVGDPLTAFRLMLLLRRRRWDAFCLNDTDSDGVAEEDLSWFLPTYFPFTSPFESPDPEPDPKPGPGQEPDRAPEREQDQAPGPATPAAELPTQAAPARRAPSSARRAHTP